jgi:DNA-binding transcriptional LysR family regulator
MRKRDALPALDLLKAFEVAARHLSFTRAGAELFLSQSAVSRQIQQLEQQVGTALFVRRTRALLLTEAGQRYYREVADILQRLRDATSRLTARGAETTVTVTTSVTFASLWLVPRLGDFQQRHPDVNVHLAADNTLRDLERDRLDVAIRYATRRLAGTEASKLFGESVAPVCSPRLQARNRLETPEDLVNFPLIHYEDPEQQAPWLAWDVWFEVMNVKQRRSVGAMRFSHYDQVVRAAVEGQGMALGRLPLITPLLKEGKLVMPLRAVRYRTSAQDRAYWLVVSPPARGRPEVAKFTEWLKAESATTSARSERESC